MQIRNKNYAIFKIRKKKSNHFQNSQKYQISFKIRKNKQLSKIEKNVQNRKKIVQNQEKSKLKKLNLT